MPRKSLAPVEAFCNAVPMLAGYEAIRDFIARAAHGILIGAFPNDQDGSSSTPRSPLPHPTTSPKLHRFTVLNSRAHP